jgi:hypothetical protein
MKGVEQSQRVMTAETEQRKSEFRIEADMAGPVMRWMSLQGLDVKSEFLLPWGVCDLVGIKFDRAKTRQRLAYGQTRPIGSFVRLLILSKIPDFETGRSISVARLSKQLGGTLDRDLLLREIDVLTRANFVKSSKRGSVQKLNGWVPIHTKLVAVELKLARVSEAVCQAVSNLQFATQSYVALPMKRALTVADGKIADVFIRNGIGLLGVSVRSCREVIWPQTAAGQNVLIQMHAAERFWRTRGN